MRNRSIRFRRRFRRGLTVAGVTALSAALVGLGSTTSNAAPNARKAFPGSVPAFVSSAEDTGTSTATVEGEVFLDLQDTAGARQLATAVSTPGNPQYGKYLKPQTWINRYAPTASDLADVKKYLKSSGMTITAVPASREYVVFRGPAAAVNPAFGTSLHNYKVDGSSVSAPSAAPTLPASVAGKVLGISLGNARAQLTRPTNIVQGEGVPGAKPASSTIKGSGADSSGSAKQAPQTQPAQPKSQPKSQAGPDSQAKAAGTCSTYYGERTAKMPKAYGRTKFPTHVCGYLPSQLRSAADLDRSINAGYDGSGQTIGIVDAYASPTIVQDTDDYMRAAGEPLLSRFRQIGAKPADFADRKACGYPSGWQGEETLDVQSAHSVAPGANILYSGGYNCGGGLDIALSGILDKGAADLVSNSYGYPGEAVGNDLIRGQQNIQLQAAGEGIGLYYSTGDDGDSSVDFGYPTPDWPATSPYVTAVGGTSEAIDARGKYSSEVGWGDVLDQATDSGYAATLPGNLYGGGTGGGISSVIAEPSYQQGVVPTSLSGRGNQASRVIPDVADLADPYTGFQIAIRPIIDDKNLTTGPLEYDTYGGTSLASPLVAAKMAIVEQLSGHRIGFANPALYQQAKQHPGAFHDVRTPDSEQALSYTSATTGAKYLVTLDQGLSLKTRTGYDDMTGIGSLQVPNLATALGGGQN